MKVEFKKIYEVKQCISFSSFCGCAVTIWSWLCKVDKMK